MGVLSESLQGRLALLDEEMSHLASEVRWAVAKADMDRERAGRRQIRKLTVKKVPEE